MSIIPKCYVMCFPLFALSSLRRNVLCQTALLCNTWANGLSKTVSLPPRGKQWRERQMRKITDKVFYRFKDETGKAYLKFEDLYIAILLVYNDINKHLPGPHFDPPSKEEVRALMQECDMNLDGELDHEEFVKFVKRLTKDTFIIVSQGLIITLAVAPTVALLTKRTTEGVPGVGKVVQKIPNAVYASLVTLTIVMFQKAAEAKAI